MESVDAAWEKGSDVYGPREKGTTVGAEEKEENRPDGGEGMRGAMTGVGEEVMAMIGGGGEGGKEKTAEDGQEKKE